MDRQADLSLAHAVELQPDESSGMCFVDLLVDEVLNGLPVHPRLNARSSGDDAQMIPSVVDEVGVTVVDLLL
jgi:hypothetical protein